MDRNSKLADIKDVAIVICFLFLIIGCLPEPKQKELAPYPYIKELNPNRKMLGLKEIDSSFLRYNEGVSYSTKNKKNVYTGTSFILKTFKEDRQSKSPYFYAKSISFDRGTGELVKETDTYRSGRSGKGFEEIYYESLSFRYYYRENQEVNRMTKDTIYHKKGDWVYQYSNIDSYSLTSSNDPSQLFKVFWKLKTTEVSEKIADSILNSWGLKRKNY